MRRGHLFCLLTALFLLPAPDSAGPGIKPAAAARLVMSEGEYREALTFIDGTRAAMADAEAALGAEEPHEAARRGAAARRDDLGQRLDMLRRLMTAAAQRDRIGAKGSVLTPERARARDVIARAGAIEDPLQDLWTAWSQRARGETAAFTLAPLPR
ncbi:MAG: hypothetical protein CVT72_00105 [Alphaproteobacteria bacterium HGW-Alphaproteobacteria-11]|nr:MAG: hypothetical protein CVT72_00105 [Alphaproteobacteria bacterium HGW-Alphaproteobacteria-11]